MKHLKDKVSQEKVPKAKDEIMMNKNNAKKIKDKSVSAKSGNETKYKQMPDANKLEVEQQLKKDNPENSENAVKGNALRTHKGYPYIKRTFMFYKKYMGLFILIVVLSLIASGIGILIPIIEGNLIGSFTTNLVVKTIAKWTILGFILVVCTQVFYYFLNIAFIKLTNKIMFDVKHTMINSLVGLETKSFDKTNSGVFISRINKDASELSRFYLNLVDVIAELITNFGFLVYVAFINIYIFLFMIVNTVIIYFIENHRLKLLFTFRKNYKEADEKIVGTYGELVRGVRDVKCLNLKQNAIKKADKLQSDAIVIDNNGSIRNQKWVRVRRVFSLFTDVLLIALSVFLIINNYMTVAVFLIIYLYKGNITGFINYFVNIKESFTNGELAAERVFEVIDEKIYTHEKFGTKTIENFTGLIEFDRVNFSYTETQNLFKDLSFKILPNQTVGIVGKSGQGKSTILSLINKLYVVNEGFGNVKLDGININELDENTIRNNITCVMQTPYVFNTSITENLQLVKEDATKEEMIDACKKAQIHEFILSLDKGYESIVGENGVVLSGGQRQRLAIARALLKNSKIILLDEATSALDNESQGKIKSVIDTLSKDHTILIVAHRLSTVVDCDKILFLENQKIIAEDSHNNLMKHCKEYKELYKKELLEESKI